MVTNRFLIGALIGCILLLLLLLCYKCRCCAQLKSENRILRWFFEQQARVDANYRKAYYAMRREAIRAKEQPKSGEIG